jgi:hypothetical protein
MNVKPAHCIVPCVGMQQNAMSVHRDIIGMSLTMNALVVRLIAPFVGMQQNVMSAHKDII